MVQGTTQDNNGPAGNNPTTDDQNQADKLIPRKRRHWKRWVVALLLLIILVGTIIPPAISTDKGTQIAVGMANGWLPGKLAIQDLSLKWLGPCNIKGARLSDPQGREVLKVAEIETPKGVLKTILSTMQFGEVTFKDPEIVLYANKNGRFSLQDAVSRPSTAAPSQEPVSLPRLIGRIIIKNGLVRMVQPDGKQIDISQINTSCALDTLNNIESTINLQLAHAGSIEGIAKIQHLAPDGHLQMKNAIGELKLSSPAEMPIANLVAFAMDKTVAAGNAGFALDVKLDKGTLAADLKTNLSAVQIRQENAAVGQPVDGRLSANLQYGQEAMTGKVTIESQAGRGEFNLDYPLTGQPKCSVDGILSAILGGQPDTLPKGTLDGHCQIDLAKLAQSIPAVMAIRPDVEVTSGALQIEQFSIHGSPGPSISSKLALANFATRTEGKTAQWEPTSLNLNATVESQHGLKISQAEFNSGFGQIKAAGTASDLHADFQADLTSLQKQASQVLDIGNAEVAGKVDGSLTLKRVSDSRLDFSTAVNTDAFRYRQKDQNLHVGKTNIQMNGHVVLTGSDVKEILITNTEVNADDKFLATGTGQVIPSTGGYQARVDVKQADLAYLTEILKGLGTSSATSYTGSFSMQSEIRKAADNAISSNGKLVMRNATVNGRSVSSDDISLDWSELSLAPSTHELKLKTAYLASAIARVSLNQADLRTGTPFSAAGGVEGNADLAEVLSILSSMTGKDKPPAIAGQLAFKGQCQSAANRVQLNSNWNIDNFEVGSGTQTIREKQVRLTADSTFDRAQDLLDIAQLQLDSRLLGIKLNGRISEVSTIRRLALKGEYSGSWDAITTLLHELAPATTETVILTGNTGSRFEITGTAYQPTMNPVYEDVTTSGLGLGWGSARIGGVDMSKAMLTPTLRQGTIQIPMTVIPSALGQIRLGGLIDLRPTNPTYILKEKTQILENVKVTPEMGKQLLSRINPLFGSCTSLEGIVSIILEGVQLPMGEALQHEGSGKGQIVLQNTKLAPTGLLAELIKMSGQNQDMYSIKVEGINFEMKKGRIHYDNCRLVFPNNFDLGFRGSVGFDNTVDLLMSVPIGAGFLERCGVHGPVAEYARLLTGARIDVPFVGTRLEPKLDFSKVDMKPLVERAIQAAAVSSTGDLLKDLTNVGRTGVKEPTVALPSIPPIGKPPADQSAKPTATERKLDKILPLLKEPSKTAAPQPAATPPPSSAPSRIPSDAARPQQQRHQPQQQQPQRPGKVVLDAVQRLKQSPATQPATKAATASRPATKLIPTSLPAIRIR